MGAARLQPVPADVRQSRRVGDGARRRPAGSPSIRASSSSERSNSSCRPRQMPTYHVPARDALHDGVRQAPAPQALPSPDALAPTPGTTMTRAPSMAAGVLAIDRPRAPRSAQRVADAHEVAGAVVDDGDARPSVTPRVPFVDATPTRRGSMATAARSDRASALNAASAMWWSLRPEARRWSVAPAVRANDSSACSTSWVESAPMRSPRNGRSSTAYGRPDRSSAHGRERLVHGHRRVAEAGDAGAVAERLGRSPRRASAPRPRPCGARRSRGRPSPRSRGR